MFCPQCGTANEANANFCKKCGFHLPAVQPKPVPVSNEPVPPTPEPVPPTPQPVPETPNSQHHYEQPAAISQATNNEGALPPNTSKIISIIAAAMLGLGFFLPWISTASRHARYGDYDDYDKSPTINGINAIKEMFDGNPKGGFMLVLIILLLLLLSIPVFSIVYLLQKVNQRPGTLKLRTLAVALAVFFPLLFLTLHLFASSIMGGSMTGDQGLGIGMIFMFLGAAFLFGEVIYIISKKSDTAGTLPKAWGKAAIAAGITAGLHLVLIEILKGSKNMEGDTMLTIYVLFIIAVLAVGVNVALNVHKSQDLRGQLSFERCIGFSLMYGMLTGLASYLVLMIVAPKGESGEIPGGVIMVLIALNTLFSFVFGAFYAINSPRMKPD